MSNTVKTEHKLSCCIFFFFFYPTKHVTQSHFTATLVNVMQVFPPTCGHGCLYAEHRA